MLLTYGESIQLPFSALIRGRFADKARATQCPASPALCGKLAGEPPAGDSTNSTLWPAPHPHPRRFRCQHRQQPGLWLEAIGENSHRHDQHILRGAVDRAGIGHAHRQADPPAHPYPPCSGSSASAACSVMASRRRNEILPCHTAQPLTAQSALPNMHRCGRWPRLTGYRG